MFPLVNRCASFIDSRTYTWRCKIRRREDSPKLEYWVGIEGLFRRFFIWLAHRMPNERQRLLVITIIAGGVCGLAAVAFHLSVIHLYGLFIERAASAPGHAWIWWTILTPALGGLVAGIGLTYWVPAAAGSGIPQVETAYTFRYGAISLKETIGKFVLCTLQLGSGASLGVEGPTVQICAGVSSFLSRVARLSPENSKRMTSVGMAAGIAAAFNAPLAAVTFTIEELVGSLDQAVLIGVIIAAALAAVVEHSILGSNPVFQVPRLQTYSLTKASSLVWYALLGLLAAIVSVVFTDSLLALRAWFKRLKKVPKWVQPAIGGAAAGSLAVVAILLFHLNGIAGDPYKTLTQALLGNLPVAAMAALCVLKLAATVTSYSSGGSGGIFAPALFMGGMLGGAVGYLDVTVFHHSADSIGAFAVVGMGAAFAGIVRAPITSILIIYEMTSGYGLVLPMMIANMSAFALARYWRHTPVYEALLAQDGIDLHEEQSPHHLEEEPLAED
jgi:CIC family chloride channel protein